MEKNFVGNWHSSEFDPASHEKDQLLPGTNVILHGLKGQAYLGLNGQKGTVLKLDPETSRVVVQVVNKVGETTSSRLVKVRRENLHLCSSTTTKEENNSTSNPADMVADASNKESNSDSYSPLHYYAAESAAGNQTPQVPSYLQQYAAGFGAGNHMTQFPAGSPYSQMQQYQNLVNAAGLGATGNHSTQVPSGSYYSQVQQYQDLLNAAGLGAGNQTTQVPSDSCSPQQQYQNLLNAAGLGATQVPSDSCSPQQQYQNLLNAAGLGATQIPSDSYSSPMQQCAAGLGAAGNQTPPASSDPHSQTQQYTAGLGAAGSHQTTQVPSYSQHSAPPQQYSSASHGGKPNNMYSNMGKFAAGFVKNGGLDAVMGVLHGGGV